MQEQIRERSEQHLYQTNKVLLGGRESRLQGEGAQVAGHRSAVRYA